MLSLSAFESLRASCYPVDVHACALLEGEACLWNLSGLSKLEQALRWPIGTISRAKEASCLLDFGLSGVRNEGFVGLEILPR